MSAGKYLNYDGQFMPADQAVIRAENACFKFGNGFFDTLLFVNGKIVLEDYHTKRWNDSIKKLSFHAPRDHFENFLLTEVSRTAEMNYAGQVARIRISFFAQEEKLYVPFNHLSFIVMAYHMQPSELLWDRNGLNLGIFRSALKVRDSFSHIKTSSSLHYLSAAHFAAANGFDDVIILNESGNVVETTIANIYIIKNGTVITPPLAEGCIEGTMRKYLLSQLSSFKKRIVERPVTEEDVLDADEVFISNAIKGIKYVRTFRNRSYDNQISENIYNRFIAPLYKNI